MNTLSWNCRGFGNSRIIKALNMLVLAGAPSLVFLMETKLPQKAMKRMSNIKNSLGLTQGLAVPSVGKSGGLALLWKPEIKVEIQTFSHWHIDAVIDSGGSTGQWRLTGFYGNPDTHGRSESWARLSQLAASSNLPWLSVGDFNEVLNVTEKQGGLVKPSRQIDSFRCHVNSCGLKDIGYVGSWFTWCMFRNDLGWIRERIDRGFATKEWINLFPGARLYHLASSASDHCCLMLRFNQKVQRRKPKKMFRFESMWLKDKKCGDIVNEVWTEGELMGVDDKFSFCMERCREALSKWNMKEFGHIGK